VVAKENPLSLSTAFEDGRATREVPLGEEFMPEVATESIEHRKAPTGLEAGASIRIVTASSATGDITIDQKWVPTRIFSAQFGY
jgi:hypothetical protein